MLTSINGIVVICFTPILTKLTLKWNDLDRIRLGLTLQIVGICSYFFYQDELVLYIISMIVFTLGEILHTLGMGWMILMTVYKKMDKRRFVLLYE